jgi:hypothetical protein
MNTMRRVLHTIPFAKTIHWKLLIFLLLFLNVKLAVKLVAILFIYLLQPNFRFGFRLKNSRLPLFYPLVIVIAIVNTIIYGQIFQVNYLMVLLVGIGIWTFCILAIHQVKNIVDSTNPEIIFNTLVLFFLVNSLVSIAEFIRIIFETGAINPFRYQGEYQKYFISTGDYIRGISFDTSTTNAVLNAFGIVFFLWKRSWLMVLICTCTLLLTASNMVNLVLFGLLLFLLLFKSTKEQKSIITACFVLLAVFMAKISPQNNQYAGEVFEKIFPSLKKEQVSQAKKMNVREIENHLLTAEQQKEKIALLYLDSLNKTLIKQKSVFLASVANIINKKPSLPEANIHTAPYQNRNDTNAVRKELLEFISAKDELKEQETKYSQTNLPGKAIAFLQTGNYIFQNPKYLFTGTGLANFSSKMAFKATTLKFAGGFPLQFSYINPDFSSNHLSLYLHFFSEHSKKHSLTNSPNSVYDQLLSEYGLIGLTGLLLFYIGFFAKHYKKLSYGIPLAFLLSSFFFIDYWFEQLSIVIIFELMLLLNIKENTKAA